MKTNASLVCTLLVILCFVPPTVSRAQTKQPSSPESIPASAAKSIQVAVQQLIEKRGYPGFSIGIVYGDNLVYCESFGVSDRRTMRVADANTLYQIGSISKVFTATLLIRMRDEGRIRLDDSLSKYLPAQVVLPHDERGAPAITLRQLATHSSGLPPDVVNPSRAKDGDPWTGYSVNKLYRGLKETKLSFPTGARWGYSNLGYGLLGLSLARAGKSSYETLLKHYIFAPLKMEHSTITLDAASRARLAKPYRDDDPEVETQPWDLGVLSSAGGISSSVADLSRFLELQFHAGESGVTPVSGSSLLELQTPQRFITDWKSANGLGWRIANSEKVGNIVFHGGDVDGYASYMGFSPVHKIGVIVLTNSGIGQPVGQLGDWLMQLAVETIRPSLSKLPSLDEANAYHQRGDWKNSIWAYERITEADPRNGEAYSRLGLALTRLQKYDDAMRAYETALSLKFRPANTMYNLACVYALKGDYDKAIDLLERSVSAGFRDGGLLRADKDLDKLRDDPRFKAIIQHFP